MKTALLFAFLIACAPRPARADGCPPGEVQVMIAEWDCDLYQGPNGSYYECIQRYYCESACAPYECADAKETPVGKSSGGKVADRPRKRLTNAR